MKPIKSIRRIINYSYYGFSKKANKLLLLIMIISVFAVSNIACKDEG